MSIRLSELNIDTLNKRNILSGESTLKLNDHIIKRTWEQIQDFINILFEIEEKDFQNILQTDKNIVIEQLTYIKRVIISSIKSYLKGDIIGCYNHIYSTYFLGDTLQNQRITYRVIPPNFLFYRARIKNFERNYFANEMFHIPFNQTEKISNQRFSLSGYPCLYLGLNPYICWEELKRPSLNKMNFSALTNENELIIFDLTPPDKIRKVCDLYKIPLIIACSLKCKISEASFKPEYIIPQALLHSIIRFNKNNFQPLSTNHKKINGIGYLSNYFYYKNLTVNSKELATNIIIPTINNTDAFSGYCDDLVETFKLSQGIDIKTIIKEENLNYNLDELIKDNINKFHYSIFKHIEVYLSKIEKSKITQGLRRKESPYSY